MTVQTYGANAAFKAAFLAEIASHEQADALVKGSYGQMNGGDRGDDHQDGAQRTRAPGAFHGCAIGCAVFSLHRLQGKNAHEAAKHPQDHQKVATDLGWPLWLAYLEDNLFESLPAELSKTWPRRLAEAVPVGAVIDDSVLAKILVWSLTADTYGVIHATDDQKVKGWVTTIADYITADGNGTLTADQWEAAWDARAARAAWDAWAAWDAMAARAAWAARDARAAWAARAGAGFYPALSEYVLSLLRELPVKEVTQ